MQKYIIATIAGLLCLVSSGARAQSPDQIIRVTKYIDRLIDPIPLRTEFISYTLREDAEKGARARNQHYKELDFDVADDGSSRLYTAVLDVPVLWLDREIFLHADGFPGFTDVIVNNRQVAQTKFGVLPEEFNITPYIVDGPNSIELRSNPRVGGQPDLSSNPAAFIYSQPKIRIEDFLITVEPDSLYTQAKVNVQYSLSNGYNFPEMINLGYDIYDPKGKLKHFDNVDLVVPGNGRDTLVRSETIYGMKDFMWTAENPALYKGMLIVKHGRRITEYIPFRVGFGTTEVADGKLLRNGKPVEINAVRYNAAPDAKTTAEQLSRLKKAGINTIMVDYPQPCWFYDLTDETGFYVFDQPDMNYIGESGERELSTTFANDPRGLYDAMYRTKAMFARSRNHPSIVGWSLAGHIGNGYNLYKTYQWLKRHEPSRPVIYNSANGEWNTDMAPIPARDAREILDAPEQQAAPAQKRRR